MKKQHWQHYLPYLSIASRIILAVVGSYAVATLTALAFLGLPIDTISAIYWGQIASVVVCTAMIILIFSLRSIWHTWMAVIAIAGVLGVLCYATI